MGIWRNKSLAHLGYFGREHRDHGYLPLAQVGGMSGIPLVKGFP